MITAVPLVPRKTSCSKSGDGPGAVLERASSVAPAALWFDGSGAPSKLDEVAGRPPGWLGSAHEAAVLEERNRIAREIHDTLAQGLAAIRLQLELARTNDELPAGASPAIQLAHKIANENFADARRLISSLRSPSPCLVTALSTAVERARRMGPARVL